MRTSSEVPAKVPLASATNPLDSYARMVVSPRTIPYGLHREHIVREGSHGDCDCECEHPDESQRSERPQRPGSIYDVTAIPDQPTQRAGSPRLIDTTLTPNVKTMRGGPIR